MSNTGADKPIDIIMGFCWNTSGSPSINDNIISKNFVMGDFSVELNNLTPNTNYYYRAFAKNSAGTAYGAEKSFSTLAIPILRSDTSVNVTFNSAKIGGSIIHDGGNEIITAGICWKIDTLSVDWSTLTLDLNDSVLIAPKGSVNFSFTLNGLRPYRTYIYRTYITTSKGTFYAKLNYFVTPIEGGVTSFLRDVDGHVYKTITIKNMEWMREKLKTKHYANNDSISFISDINLWPGLKTGAYRVKGGWDDRWNQEEKLYNFYAIIDSRNVCPVGWHVSTSKDWQNLVNYFGGYKRTLSAMSSVMHFYYMDLAVWILSEDKKSTNTIIYDNHGNLSIEMGAKYPDMNVMCVKDE